MSWVLVKTTDGHDLAVNLDHVIQIAPLKIEPTGKLGARLRTTQAFDDGRVYLVDVETSWESLLRRTGIGNSAG